MKQITRRWFSIKAEADTAEVSIFDEIGAWGINLADFKKELDRVRDAKSITLNINSPGGDVFQGMAIYNLLAGLREKITVRVLGLAGSIASIIALAGKSLVMSEGSYFMIHEPRGVAAGTGDDLRQVAMTIDSVKRSMISIYAARCRFSPQAIDGMMREETWLTADEAVDAGFAASVERSAEMAALADLSKYNFQRTPRAVLDRVVTEKHSPPPTARDLERLLRDAGYSRRIAAGIVAKGISAVDHAGCKDSATGPGIGSGGEAGGRKFFSIGVQNLFETGVTHANS